MSREMKFKVFFYDGSDYSTGGMWSLESAFKENYVEIIGNAINPTDDCSILLEYTGVFDINKREICEGDIVISEGNKREISFYKGRLTPVTKSVYKDKDGNEKEKIDMQGVFMEENIKKFKIEVIGNIYENPELLK